MVLLISGCLGSGKSLLCRLCNTHPEIKIRDDFHSFDQLDVSYLEHVRALRIRSRNTKLWHYRHWGAIALYLTLIWLRSLRDGQVGAHDVEAVLRRLSPSASVVGDAYAKYAFNLEKLVGVAGIRQVVIYRDCRDVAATIEKRLKGTWYSYLHSPEPPAWIESIATPVRVAETWLGHIRAMEKHRDNVYLIRYEDLVADPQMVLAQLGHWLGVDPDQFQSDFIHTDEVGAYEQILSEQDVADILRITGPTLEQLGHA